MRIDGIDIPDIDNDDALDLGAVELVRFAATPPSIGPFGSSTLDWRIDAPDRPILFTLNNRTVAAAASQTVSPRQSTNYVLRARLGRLSRVLGTRRVDVDLTDCQEFEFRRIFEPIRDLLVQSINSDPNTVFRTRGLFEPRLPEVTFDSGAIRIRLFLRRLIEDRPNPDVTMTLRFGLGLDDGVLVPTRPSVSARVTVPFWVWLIPGSILAIPPLLNNAEQDAEQTGRRMIDQIVAFVDALTNGAPGTTKQAVRFFEDDRSEVLALTFCGAGTPPVD